MRRTLFFLTLFFSFNSYAQKPRARQVGIPFDGTPGTFNAITDVKGVEVGFSTIISGQGKNVRGQDPVRNDAASATNVILGGAAGIEHGFELSNDQ